MFLAYDFACSWEKVSLQDAEVVENIIFYRQCQWECVLLPFPFLSSVNLLVLLLLYSLNWLQNKEQSAMRKKGPWGTWRLKTEVLSPH
jgi:cytochrome bd-type quinol oxidase subunit 2